MKKQNLVALGGVFLALSVLVGACNSAGSGSDDAPGSYVVSFTVDGTDYVLTEGYTAEDVFDSGANGSLSSEGVDICLGASAPGVSAMGVDGPYLFISVSGNTTGTYTSTDIDINLFFGVDQDHYTIDGGMGGPPPDPRSVTITTISGTVGGTIEGTFSGTLTGGAGTIEVTNGSFVVERLADGAVEVPRPFF